MSIPQAKLREAVFQLLYSHDFAPCSNEEAIPMLMAQLSISKRNARLAVERVRTVQEKITPIDEKISAASTTYSLEALGSVERNILRLALFEVLYDPEVPEAVALAEALRLCKKFTIPESTRYVHAIISTVIPKKAPVS